MGFIEVNGARIFYETYGDDQPGRAPILLIHGSTVDGRTDWAEIAPALAARYKVLVPDCRGHGKSNNPRRSYSFAELADDAVAFLRALGYERAHVIGHSNGGNVALVTLMEHPDAVQTCIPQAANAYVSRYLVEREPIVMDADYVAKNDPDMMNAMIRLHEEVNGAGYWRDLLWLTMKEIISEPNYSPAELARVDRPVLVIQGAEDPVNAPDEHAQYIANNIPNAELWIPEGTGHNVHVERREEWARRVLEFLEGKG
jgi:pimeloyl-ACP methyl ester carboxylesterase